MTEQAGQPSEYLATIASFVPEMILRQANAGQGKPTEASLEETTAAVLFVDIAGFTALTESLAQRGDAGAEDLTRVLNLYIGQLIDAIVDRGGDIVKFAGDALIAIWPASDAHPLTVQLDRALVCALDIRDRLGDVVVAEQFRMRVKLVAAAGQVWMERLGGVFNRWELLIAGDALQQIGVAADYVEAGDVIVTGPTRTHLNGRIQGQEAPAGGLRVTALDLAPLTAGIANGQVSHPVPQPHAAAVIRDFIPAAVRSRLEMESVEWLGELRNITVLFINLPDFGVATPLPEAQAAMRTVQVELYRFEGSINKMSVDDKGASLLAVYGLPPLSHADDPERAVRAAGAVHAALRKAGLRSWIGVASGSTFCGVIGNARRREYTVMGDVVNLAARLMQAASGAGTGTPVPGGILCCAETWAASNARLSFETLAPIMVKGKAEPVAVYRPAPRKRTTGQDHLTSPIQVVGREAERTAIEAMLGRLKDSGSSQLMALVGDGGIGKSRLLQEASRLAGQHGMVTLIGAGDPIETATPYFAWRRVFEKLLLTDADADNDADQRDDETLRALASAALPSDPAILRDMPLLEAVLPLGWPDNEFTSGLSGKARSERTRQLLAHILSDAGGGSTPKLVVMKDAHRLDSASLALLDDVANLPVPIALIASCRALKDDADTDWGRFVAEHEFEQLTPGPLDAASIEAICCRSLGVDKLPNILATFVVDRSEGNPRFAEELVLSLQENEIIATKNGAITIAAGREDADNWALPKTMEGVIAARIDRLPVAEQMTLKVASVIGRFFGKDALSVLHPTEQKEGELERQCQVLSQLELTPQVKAGSLLDKTAEASKTWKFKSSLLKDVAYNRMLYAQRRELHRRMAIWIEATADPEQMTLAPLLAFHWRHAAEDRELDPGAALKAAEYYGRAANHAMHLHALKEAIDDWQQALALLDRLPQSAARDSLELKLLLELGPAEVAAGSYSAPEVEAVFDRARALGEAAGEHGLLFRALRGQWQVRIGRGEYRKAMALANELLVLAERADDPAAILEAWRCKGTTAFWTAEFDEACSALSRSIETYGETAHRDLVSIYGQDPKVAAMGLLAWTLAHLGFDGEARACAEKARAWAEDLKHPFSTVYAYGAMMWTGYFLDDRDYAATAARLCTDLALERGYPYFVAAGQVVLGWANRDAQSLDETVTSWRTAGGGIGMTIFLLVQADVQIDAGHPDVAKTILRERALVEQVDNDIWLKPLHRRLLSSAEHLSGETSLARNHLMEARTAADLQGATLHTKRIDKELETVKGA